LTGKLSDIDMTDFRAAGSPVLFNHNTESWPLGTLGEVWEGKAPSGEDAVFGRVHFATTDEGEKAWQLCKSQGMASSIRASAHFA
jgi:hypothetical protein